MTDYIDIFDACRLNNINAVKKYISSEGDVNKINHFDSKNSVLHTACKFNRYDIAILLLKNGADINKENAHGDTCICYTIIFNRLHFFDLLIKYGAHINENKLSYYGLIACSNGLDKIARRLIINGETLKATKTNLEYMFTACENCNPSIVEMLIDNGMDVNFLHNGNTYLHIACNNKLQYPNDKAATIKILMDKGVHANKKNYFGQTPLDITININKCDIHKIIKKEINKRIYILSLLVQHDALKHHIIKKYI